ncbi:N-acyl amino acid synthase FeeM domain-containing protein [Zeimonas arvi]|uniref:N-acyl amino acid synthase FeeM catalytic core domain-containing protein n=1 Tax=Zeimonas arvi TaxID=2498847 RepID=A0A5C8P4F4_9BURK|nr:hypothetical protein [Zeimonas arvi]TXL68400.1 hypothetical protein FHP08_01565 [Zeimonas arvi]
MDNDSLAPVLSGSRDSGRPLRRDPGSSERVLADSGAEPLVEIPAKDDSRLTIRLADDNGRRNQASYLLHKRYGWRGYTTAQLPDDPNCVTLVALDDAAAVATLTIGFDSPAGMSACELYPDEVSRLRETGARLCEFTRFAVDRSDRSLELLAMMFHVAYLLARRQRGATHVLAEVNPRHLHFYTRMLDFQQIGPERTCPRVNAPAVLLSLSLEFGERQIARYGGKRELARKIRSLYPLSFSTAEEAGIAERLLRARP